MNNKADAGLNKPFLLYPAAKDYLWGGSRLNDDFGKNIPLSPLAETWECSTHPDGQSVVADTGEKLGDVLAAHPEYLGTHPLETTGGKPELRSVRLKRYRIDLPFNTRRREDGDVPPRHRGKEGKSFPLESGFPVPEQPGDEINPACCGHSSPTGRHAFCQ